MTLLDSGSSLNVISQSMFSVLKQDVVFFKSIKKSLSPINVTLPGSNILNLKEKFLLHFKINSLSWSSWFYVAKSIPFDVIIGSPTLKSCRIVINFDSSLVAFSHSPHIEIPFVICSSVAQQFLNLMSECKAVFSPKQKKKLSDILASNAKVLSPVPGRAKNFAYHIMLKDKEPVRRHPYYLPKDKTVLLQDHIAELVHRNILFPVQSPYASPVFFVKKKQGFRLVGDFRFLNKKILFDPLSGVNMNSVFNSLANAKFFSTLDMSQSFYQIPLDEESKAVSAIVTSFGQFAFNVCPFGMVNSAQALNRFLLRELADFRHFLSVYYDDLIIYSSTLDEHIDHINALLTRFKKLGLTINPDKIQLGMTRLKILGHLVTSEGRIPDPTKVEAIKQLSPPKNLKEVQTFLGMVAFYAKFIPQFGIIAAPLNALKRKGVKFKFGESEMKAFNSLKQKLSSPPVLKFYDPSKNIFLCTDASSVGIGAVLMQESPEGRQPVEYFSRRLRPTETRYSAYELELLAVISAINHFKDYLLDKHFVLETDSSAIVWLLNSPTRFNKLSRWILTLSRFNFTPVHVRGVSNYTADCLSRLFQQPDETLNSDVFANNSEDPLHFLNALVHSPHGYISIKQAQKLSDECKSIYHDIKSGLNVNKFVIHNGLLMRLVGHKNLKRIVLPSTMLDFVFKYFHDDVHEGTLKTYRQIARRFWKKDLFNLCKTYVTKCETCARVKPNNQPNAVANASVPCLKVWSKIYIDFVGPIISSSRNSYRYIFTVFDAFSKWLLAIPTKRATAAVVIRNLSCIFNTHGYPGQVVSDNGPAFRSEKYSNFLFLHGVRTRYTSPYYPKANMVERLHRNLKINLTATIRTYATSHKDWPEFLSIVIFKYNSSFHSAINTSPAAVFLGRELTTTCDRILNIENLINIDEKADMNKVVESVTKAHAAYKRSTSNLPKQRFKLNQKVWREIPPSPSTTTHHSKFADKFDGPYTIVEFSTPVNVCLYNEKSKTMIRSHVSKLKKV